MRKTMQCDRKQLFNGPCGEIILSADVSEVKTELWNLSIVSSVSYTFMLIFFFTVSGQQLCFSTKWFDASRSFTVISFTVNFSLLLFTGLLCLQNNWCRFPASSWTWQTTWQTQDSLQLFPLELTIILVCAAPREFLYSVIPAVVSLQPDELRPVDRKVTAIRQQAKTVCRSLSTNASSRNCAGSSNFYQNSHFTPTRFRNVGFYVSSAFKRPARPLMWIIDFPQLKEKLG